MSTVQACDVRPGMTLIIDGEPRKVDSIGDPLPGGVAYIDFESPDRDPDGTPAAYLSRAFGVYDHVEVAEE